MKRNSFLLVVFLLIQVTGRTQKDIKPKFISINQFGAVWGSTDDALLLQTINGVAYKDFSAGVGIGLDYYWERTVPLFIDLRKNLFSKTRTPFVYADLGVNMPWVKAEKDSTWFKSKYSNGQFFDVGIGYRVPVSNKLLFNMSFGYSQKKLHEERHRTSQAFDFFPHSQNYMEHHSYTLRRFSLKAGLSF